MVGNAFIRRRCRSLLFRSASGLFLAQLFQIFRIGLSIRLQAALNGLFHAAFLFFENGVALFPDLVEHLLEVLPLFC